MVHIFFLDGMKLVPEGQRTGDHKSDEDADQEEQAVGWESDEEDGDDGDRNEKSRGALQTKTQARPGRRRHIGSILRRWQDAGF